MNEEKIIYTKLNDIKKHLEEEKHGLSDQGNSEDIKERIEELRKKRKQLSKEPDLEKICTALENTAGKQFLSNPDYLKRLYDGLVRKYIESRN